MVAGFDGGRLIVDVKPETVWEQVQAPPRGPAKHRLFLGDSSSDVGAWLLALIADWGSENWI